MRFIFDVMSANAPIATQGDIVASLIEALVAINIDYLATHPTPALYESGIRYVETPEWRDVPALLSAGVGDCKSLVAYRIAELRRQNARAYVHIFFYRGDRGEAVDTFHVTLRTDAGIEDPSRIVGPPTATAVTPTWPRLV